MLFRKNKVGLRAAETASQNFETPFLIFHIWGPMKISELQMTWILGKNLDKNFCAGATICGRLFVIL